MERVEFEVWLGRDNVVYILLWSGDTPVADLSGTTRAVFTLNGVKVDTAVPADATKITWTDQVEYDDVMHDVVTLQLGGHAFTAGSFTDGCLNVFDATNTNGITYFDDAKVTVNADCAA